MHVLEDIFIKVLEYLKNQTSRVGFPLFRKKVLKLFRNNLSNVPKKFFRKNIMHDTVLNIRQYIKSFLEIVAKISIILYSCYAYLVTLHCIYERISEPVRNTFQCHLRDIILV